MRIQSDYHVGTILEGDTNKGVGTILAQASSQVTNKDNNKDTHTPIKRPNFSTIVVYWDANLGRFSLILAAFCRILLSP